MNSRLLFPLLANLSITLSTFITISRWTWRRASPVNLSSVILFLSHVFNLLKVEKLCSTDATLTDRVTRISRSAEIFRKLSASQFCFCKVSPSVLGILHVPALLSLRRSHRVFHIVTSPDRADSQTDWEEKPIIDQFRSDKSWIVLANCCLFVSIQSTGYKILSLKVSSVSTEKRLSKSEMSVSVMGIKTDLL